MAVKDCVVPSVICGLTGVIAIEASTAALTVIEQVPDTLARVAVIVELPVLTALTRPKALATLAILATAVLDEDQLT